LTFAATTSSDTTDTETLSETTPHTPRPRGTLRRALILSGVLGLSAVAATLGSGATAHASPGLRYASGYSVQNGWLCYGFANGAYHCTQHWHRSNGRLVSDNPGWVPNAGGGTGGAAPVEVSNRAVISAPVSHTGVQGSTSAGEPCRSTDFFNGRPSQWQVPPSCYAGIYAVNPANYVYRPGFGWCNWWPEVMNPGRPNLLSGNYRRGSTPAVGATVVFSGGVQGASSEGHYARVVAIYPGGQWMLISEMNFFWRGGGWQRVSYRYIHTGAGVSFIY
jgi:hypothetical protein